MQLAFTEQKKNVDGPDVPHTGAEFGHYKLSVEQGGYQR